MKSPADEAIPQAEGAIAVEGPAVKLLKGLTLAILILLVLQTALFTLASILASGSVVFRLCAGFAGIGVVITPVLFKGLSGLTRKAGLLSHVLSFITILYLLQAPWFRLEWLLSGQYFNFRLLIYSSRINGALPLASGCLAFSLLGFFTVFGVVDNADSVRAKIIMRILRFLLGLFFLGMGLYLMYPFFLRVLPAAALPWDLAADPLFALMAEGMGNPWIWLGNLAIASFLTYRFYREWFIEGKDPVEA